MGGVKCAVKGCKNNMKKQQELMYHRFPSQKNRCMEWLQICGRQDLMNSTIESVYKTKRVCSVHFDTKMYSNPEKTRLLPQAIPTIFDHCVLETNEDMSSTVHNDGNTSGPIALSMEDLQNTSTPTIDDNLSLNSPTSLQTSYKLSKNTSTPTIDDNLSFNSSTSSQTSYKLSSNTPRKKKLKTEVSILKSKCNNLEKEVEKLSRQVTESMHSIENFKASCDLHLPPNLSMIVKNYVTLSKMKAQGYRYSNNIKNFSCRK